jgi:uncharacterized membrane protein YcaP (DUF421 family)
MDMDKVEPFEIQRMLFGDAPPAFLVEVFIRGLLLYLYMIFIMRFLGKRMAGKLTVAEMVLTITLGGSVAVAIQVPEGGVLIGFVVLTCALLFERGLSYLAIKSKGFEKVANGGSAILISDGVLQIQQMTELTLTQQQIFAKLRTKHIHQLGEVERMYLEAGGTFSVYKKTGTPPPGLPVIPSDDETLLSRQQKSDELKACTSCGNLAPKEYSDRCPVCHQETWIDAIF